MKKEALENIFVIPTQEGSRLLTPKFRQSRSLLRRDDKKSFDELA
jgi:hypothetical protein